MGDPDPLRVRSSQLYHFFQELLPSSDSTLPQSPMVLLTIDCIYSCQPARLLVVFLFLLHPPPISLSQLHLLCFTPSRLTDSCFSGYGSDTSKHTLIISLLSLL